MASEDFSFMLEACPGAYINIGNGDTKGSCPVHNPGYDFNDAVLPLGASLSPASSRRSCRGYRRRDLQGSRGRATLHLRRQRLVQAE